MERLTEFVNHFDTKAATSKACMEAGQTSNWAYDARDIETFGIATETLLKRLNVDISGMDRQTLGKAYISIAEQTANLLSNPV